MYKDLERERGTLGLITEETQRSTTDGEGSVKTDLTKLRVHYFSKNYSDIMKL